MEKLEMLSQDGSEQTQKESNTLWTLVKDFCGYTTAHGLGRIMAATHWVRTLLWTLLFLAAVAIMTVQVQALFKKYQRRPLTTFVTVETSTSLPFPAVTFCNFNAIKNDSLERAKKQMNIFKKVLGLDETATTPSSKRSREQRFNDQDEESTSRPTLESFSSINSTDNAIVDEDDDSFSWDDEEDEEFEDPSRKEPGFLKREKLAILMAREDFKVLKSVGHRFEDMVLSCMFRGVSCGNVSSVFWTSFWHYKYGNCYTFNSGKTSSGSNAPILKSNKPGPSHGLTLELNIEQEDYIGFRAPEAGVRMDINTQGEMPFPLERGLSLAPGYATMIGLRKRVIERKDPFESNRCLKTVTKDESNLYTKHFRAVYSATACKESCLAYNQLEKCECMEYRFPGSSTHGICNVINKPTIKCLSNVQKMFRGNKLNCTDSCPPPCREEGFKISTSFSSWPSEKYELIYQYELEKNNKYLYTKDGSHRKNVCKVQVFYEELNIEVIAEQQSYEIEDFVSDIGGQLGLWIGFSVMTMAEFLELFLLLFHTAFKACRAKKTAEPSRVPERV